MIFSKFISKKFLGIDIGTSAIKIVELSRQGERINLENYGEVKAESFYAKSFRTFERNVLSLSKDDIGRGIKAILEEAKIKNNKCSFTIPDFATFFTTFELPPMSENELPQAVRYEAREYIPLPISEVTLDWRVVESYYVSKEKTKLKILLVAVPNEIINQYQAIASFSNLQLMFLEAEVFALVRALIGEEKKIVSIIDIGTRSSTCSIIEKGILKISHSFDISSNQFTARIAEGLMVDYKIAENLKRKYGILPGEVGVKEKANIRDIMLPLIDDLLREIERIYEAFYQMEGKKIQKIILAGGTAFLPGLLEYFQDYFKIEIEIANPFSKIFYPPILEKNLKEIGPSYAIAVGAALEGLK